MIACSVLAWLPSNPVFAQANYESNLQMLRGSSVRNTNHDNSRWRDTPMQDITVRSLFGPRSEYLEVRDGQQVDPRYGQSDRASPAVSGGQFRVSCEFSHFAYDDPLVHPGKPGAAHLHLFWGNTDVNAFSTYDSLFNSGSSTCNGQELNRTGYWAPAMFDDDGNVRIPMRINIYYKGYGDALGRSEVYPPRAAMIADINYHTVPDAEGGYATNSDDTSFQCSDLFRGPRYPRGNTIPVCNVDRPFTRTLEVHVKFPNCWNGQDPSNPDNWRSGSTGWGSSRCGDWVHTPNIEYIIQYPMRGNESTDGWYLSSDVNPMTLQRDKAPGSSLHADWWGGWNRSINQSWIDNCSNFRIDGVATGCGNGYLSDGGPDKNNPLPGDALKRRPEYTGPIKVAASTLFEELCRSDRVLNDPAEAAYCKPGDHGGMMPEPEPEPEPEGDFACDGQAATLVGTEGDDKLTGTGGRDVIVSLGGNDVVYALGGDDTICLGDGRDRAYGNGGEDTIFGGRGNDLLYGGNGNDVILGGPGNDRLLGNRGQDWLYGNGGRDTLSGGPGSDNAVYGGSGDDVILTRGGGDDDIDGGPGNNTIRR